MRLPAFRKNVIHAPSGISMIGPRKVYGVVAHPEGEGKGKALLGNVGNCLPIDTA